MQTFLPSPSYATSARWLDNKRLWKQCVECKQIYNSLVNGGGWQHHPAVKMWRGHEYDLLIYAMNMCCEAYARDINSVNIWTEFNEWLIRHTDTRPPPWMGNEAFHASHRSNLLRKDPKWYGQWGWAEPPDLPYIWPEVVT